MAFGTGSAVAHRALDAVMGPRTIQHEAVVSEAAAAAPAPASSSIGDACGIHSKAFQDVCCSSLFLLNMNDNDVYIGGIERRFEFGCLKFLPS